MSKPGYVSLPVSDGSNMEAYLAKPAASGPMAAVILLQEAYGVNHHIRNVADRLAREGYLVLAPELFHRTAAGVEGNYQDFNSMMPHVQALSNEGLEADLQACWQWLQSQPDIEKNTIAALGFCMGGRVSFMANALLPLAAAVSFYGGGTHQVADRAANLHAAHLFFWGGLDKHIKKEHVDAVTAAVHSAGKEYICVEISYADHGFFCDERPSYNEQAATESWALTLAFLRNRLKR